MTTIVYRAPFLAADSQMTVDDVKIDSDDKIVILNQNTATALAGYTGEIKALENFFRKDNWEELLIKGEKPTIRKDGCEGFLLYKGEVFLVDQDVYPILLVHPYYAFGSGWKFALAALHMGMSAVDAVIFASEFDVYTNNKVRCLNVQEWFANSKTRLGRGKRTKVVEVPKEGSGIQT